MSYLFTVLVVALTAPDLAAARHWMPARTGGPRRIRYLATFLTAISAARLAELLVGLLISEGRSISRPPISCG